MLTLLTSVNSKSVPPEQQPPGEPAAADGQPPAAVAHLHTASIVAAAMSPMLACISLILMTIACEASQRLAGLGGRLLHQDVIGRKQQPEWRRHKQLLPKAIVALLLQTAPVTRL